MSAFNIYIYRERGIYRVYHICCAYYIYTSSFTKIYNIYTCITHTDIYIYTCIYSAKNLKPLKGFSRSPQSPQFVTFVSLSHQARSKKDFLWAAKVAIIEATIHVRLARAKSGEREVGANCTLVASKNLAQHLGQPTGQIL